MKKFSFLSSVLLLIVVTGLLFIGCQKESNASAADDSVSGERTNIKAVAGSGNFQGSINGSYAAALQKNFSKKYDDENQTLQVAFSAKDLSAFLALLQSKYKSDIIYVNFGVYGKGAPALDPKNNGRMTVFFTGNNMPGTTGNVATDGTDDPPSDQYLNHGAVWP